MQDICFVNCELEGTLLGHKVYKFGGKYLEHAWKTMGKTEVNPGVCPQGALGLVWEEMNKNISGYNSR